MPLSPVISTVASVADTRSTGPQTFAMAGLLPMISAAGRDAPDLLQQALYLFASARCWIARCTVSSSCFDLERLGDEVVGARADRRDGLLDAP